MYFINKRIKYNPLGVYLCEDGRVFNCIEHQPYDPDMLNSIQERAG